MSNYMDSRTPEEREKERKVASVITTSVGMRHKEGLELILEIEEILAELKEYVKSLTA